MRNCNKRRLDVNLYEFLNNYFLKQLFSSLFSLKIKKMEGMARTTKAMKSNVILSIALSVIISARMKLFQLHVSANGTPCAKTPFCRKKRK